MYQCGPGAMATGTVMAPSGGHFGASGLDGGLVAAGPPSQAIDFRHHVHHGQQHLPATASLVLVAGGGLRAQFLPAVPQRRRGGGGLLHCVSVAAESQRHDDWRTGVWRFTLRRLSGDQPSRLPSLPLLDHHCPAGSSQRCGRQRYSSHSKSRKPIITIIFQH